MVLLRCTRKVLAMLDVNAPDPSQISRGDTMLGDWYVNMFVVDRRKTFIFMNEKTLLSFVIYGVRTDHVRNLPAIFLRGVNQLLTLLGFDIGAVNRALNGCEALQFTKTTSRQLLGNMNDLVDLYQYLVNYEGGLQQCDLGTLMTRINKTPQRNLGWSNSRKIATEILASRAQ